MSRNKWMAIWTEPRATIRKIVQENPSQRLWWLALIYGFASLCSMFQSFSMGIFYGPIAIFLLALVLAPIWGYLVFAVWSLGVLWTGKLFKGVGNFQELRAAYAWSCVPVVVSDAIWVVLFVLFGSSLFLPPPMEETLFGLEALLLIVLLFGKLVCAVWSIVIYLNALAEVQRFSLLRAVGNAVVGALFIGIVMTLCLMILGYILNLSLPPAEVSKILFPILQEGIEYSTSHGV